MRDHQIEELMSEHFPWVEPEDREWQNVHDGANAKISVIAELLSQHMGTHELLIHVMCDPEIYARKSASEAAIFIGSHVLNGRIHIANRLFTGFVVIQPNGVATGWHERENDDSNCERNKA